jgi:hypothetical protein
MADLEKIADDLSKLSVLEAADLSKMLKEKWGGAAIAHGATVLFEDRKRTRQEPLGRGESLFEFYDSCARHGYDEFRSLVNGWLAKMPAKDRDKLITRFRYGKNREFGSCLSELVVHAFIVGSGYRVIPHPTLPGSTKHPDYAATDQSSTAPLAYIEVTTVNPSDAEEAEENRENPVYKAVDGAKIPAGCALGYSLGRAGKSSPALKPLVADIEHWVRDNAEAAKTKEVSKSFAAGDWVIELDLYSGGSNPEPSAHAIGVIDLGGGIVSPHKDLRAALRSKSRRYGALDKPYLIAVADGKNHFFGKESVSRALTEAVFGDEIVKFRGGTAYLTHAKNGFWHAPDGPDNRHVSGILLLPDTELWKLRDERGEPVLAVNPWAERPLPDALRAMRRFEADDGHWVLKEGKGFPDLVGMPDPWPPKEPGQ